MGAWGLVARGGRRDPGSLPLPRRPLAFPSRSRHLRPPSDAMLEAVKFPSTRCRPGCQPARCGSRCTPSSSSRGWGAQRDLGEHVGAASEWHARPVADVAQWDGGRAAQRARARGRRTTGPPFLLCPEPAGSIEISSPIGGNLRDEGRRGQRALA
jgi:hypothetical protein